MSKYFVKKLTYKLVKLEKYCSREIMHYKSFLKIHNITLKEAFRYIGISYSLISRILNEKRMITPLIKDKLERLICSIEQINKIVDKTAR